MLIGTDQWEKFLPKQLICIRLPTIPIPFGIATSVIAGQGLGKVDMDRRGGFNFIVTNFPEELRLRIQATCPKVFKFIFIANQ